MTMESLNGQPNQAAELPAATEVIQWRGWGAVKLDNGNVMKGLICGIEVGCADFIHVLCPCQLPTCQGILVPASRVQLIVPMPEEEVRATARRQTASSDSAAGAPTPAMDPVKRGTQEALRLLGQQLINEANKL